MPDGFTMPDIPELTPAQRDAYMARPVTFGSYMQLADQMIRGIDRRINMALGASDRIAALESRIKELEARPAGINYCGTYQEGTSYHKGDAISFRGGLWICRKDTDVRPGDNGSGFQLAVKRPRNEMHGTPYA